MSIEARISEAYKKLSSFYFEPQLFDNEMQTGICNVAVKGNTNINAEGKISKTGLLSGMSLIYSIFNLQIGDKVIFETVAPSQLVLIKIIKQDGTVLDYPETKIVEHQSEQTTDNVFVKKKLNHIHIEIFRPENLRNWEPENEPDIYIVFGVLQEYTPYRYCCATSASLLSRLNFNAPTKPDAIIINNDTKEYLIAEFKMSSSQFAMNHSNEEIDILICWIDDATERTSLPRIVLSLKDKAKTVATEIIAQ